MAIASLLSGALLLGACADFESLGRRSDLPDEGSGESRAIHLDAKQRLVIAKGGSGTTADPAAVCAEPSPDALSAIAASAGIGASVPSQGAASAAAALQTSAASIGLRTQSITLMRDALYRVCEAYYSGQLSAPQVMLLLARSQDLTATVVAVEQLTGAVVAQQAALGGQASSQAIAALLANKQALEQIDARLQQNEKDVEAATAAQIPAQSAADAARDERDAKRDKAEAADPPDAALTRDAETAQAALDRAEGELRLKNADLVLKQQQLDETRKVRAAIAQQLDSATTSASAAASGGGQFGTNQSRDNMDKDTAAAIANAVEAIVTRVVGKNYLTDACIAILTQPNVAPSSERKATVEACYQLMKQANETELMRFSSVRSASSLEPEPVDRLKQLMALVSTLPARAAMRLASTPPVRLSADVEALVNATDRGRLRTRDAVVARAALKQMLAVGIYDAADLDAWETAIRAATPG